jgi:hypothetical protein
MQFPKIKTWYDESDKAGSKASPWKDRLQPFQLLRTVWVQIAEGNASLSRVQSKSAYSAMA